MPIDLNQKIQEFGDNADRVDQWVNDPEKYVDKNGQDVKSIPKLIDELNVSVQATVAGQARDEAEDARDLAQSFAADGEVSVALAEAAKVESQSARDAAFVNADVYPDTATGLAATVIGDQFQVVAGDLIIRYLHEAGPVATEVARYQYAELFDRILSGANAFVVVDDDDNVVIEVTSDEIIHPVIEQLQSGVDQAGALTDVIDRIPSGAGSFTVTDDEDNVVLEVTSTEIRHPAIEEIQNQLEFVGQSPDLIRVARISEPRDPQWNDLQLLAGVSMIAVMGQSNAHGNDAVPALSTSDSPWALRFIGGVRPSDNRATPIRDAFAPLSEFTNGSIGETSAAGAEQTFRQYALQEEGIDLVGSPATMLFVNHSAPGSTIEAGIASGTTAFNNMVTSMNAGATVANSNGDPFAVAALLLDIGESNQNNGTTQATYVTLNTTLRSDLQAQAQAAGIMRPLPVFINQMNTIVPGPVPAPVDGSVRPNIALAQLQLAREQDYFCLVCPSYQLPYVGPTNIHYSAAGQRIKGAYLGRAMKRWLLDGIKPRPVAPLSAWKQGKFVMVKLDVQSRTPVVIDSAAFPDAVDFGVQVVDATDAPLTIAAISIAWGDTILIELTSDTPAPAFFRYAWTGTNSGSNLGKLKGCIRDTAGENDIYDPDGLNYPLHNWLVACEEAIA